MTFGAHFLVLTEDTGGQSFDVVEAIARKMLFLVDAGIDDKLIFIDSAETLARSAMGFNGYKSTKQRDYHKRVDLAAAIATQLLYDDVPRFVLIHVDGDCRWSERGHEPGSLCELQEIFERNIVRRVRAFLDEKQRTERIDRLLYVIPFWCIESWLYQNSAELQRICGENPRAHDSDAAPLERWRSEPSLLDEVERPKRKAETFRDGFNRRLAATFPGRKVYALGQSFTASVDRLATCPALLTALRALRYTAEE